MYGIMSSIIQSILFTNPFCCRHHATILNQSPSHYSASPVSHIYPDVFVTELLYLCDIGVLDICGTSQRVSPK